MALAGDFNQWAVESALVEFPDIGEVNVGPTRGDRRIDRIFCNLARRVGESGTVPPLESEHSESDHHVAYIRASLPRFDSYEWQTFSYRHFTEEGERALARWVTLHDWTGVLEAPDSNAKAAAY